MEKKVAIAALLVALAGAIFGIGYYMLSGEPENEASLEEPQEKLKAEQEEKANNKEQPAAVVDDQNRPAKGFEEKRRAGPVHTEPSNPEPLKKNDIPPTQAEVLRETMIKKQVSLFYEDLFKELSLPEEQRKKVEDHLARSMKAETEFEFKLMDPSVSVEEVLRDQGRLSSELRADLGGVLSQRDQDVVTKHQNDLPKKMQKKQVLMLVDSLNLEGQEKENVRSAVEHAVESLEGRKKMGEYTAQDIQDLRKPFGGAKPGDPEFMRATIEDSANRVKGLLKYPELEQLPKEQYEAIKKQMEMPLEMMRQGLKQQAQQQGSP